MAMYCISHLFPIDQIFSRSNRGIVAEEALNVGRYDLSADAIFGHEPIPEDVSRHGGVKIGLFVYGISARMLRTVSISD